MPGLVPGIHVLFDVIEDKEVVDGRNKSGHDEEPKIMLKQTNATSSQTKRKDRCPR